MDILATKITGLNITAKRLGILNNFPNHPSQILISNNFMMTRNGEPTINIHKSHILMTLAITSNINHIVKKNNKINLSKNSSVTVAAFFDISIDE